MSKVIVFQRFNGLRKTTSAQDTTAANVNKQAKVSGKHSPEFFGNRWTKLQLPLAILTSQNWQQVARKMGGHQVAFQTLRREYEQLPPTMLKAA